MNKRAALQTLSQERQDARYDGCTCIGDYADGMFECMHVSPYSKSACNVDADVFVMLQDWCSDDWLRKHPEHYADLKEHGLCPSLPTNRKLAELLQANFGLALADTYASNLFPFIKPGNMSAGIYNKAFVTAAHQFGLPQIEIVQPKLVICIGQKTFNGVREALGQKPFTSFAATFASPFMYGGALVWCQAHTGSRGQQNRNKHDPKQTWHDWAAMKADFVKCHPDWHRNHIQFGGRK